MFTLSLITKGQQWQQLFKHRSFFDNNLLL